MHARLRDHRHRCPAIYLKCLMFQCHNLRRAGQCAFAALDAVGMQIARLLAATVIGRELHRTDTGTVLTLHLTGTRNVDVRKSLGQRCLLWSHPAGDGTHRTERAPCAWCIDETQRNADNGSHHDNSPKHAPDATPHSQSALVPGNGECELDAEHAEDKEHHEQAEAERTHKCRYWLVG